MSGEVAETGRYCTPDQCVDLGCLNVIQLLHRIFNLSLVRLKVGDENEGVIVFDLLHRGLGVQRPRWKLRQ